MKSGTTTVSASLLCILAAVQGGDVSPRLEVPRGFTASVYASGIDGARDLDVRADGTLTLRGDDALFEILPQTVDTPMMVMRVAAELDTSEATGDPTVAVDSPRFMQLRWDARSGELACALAPAESAGISVSPRTLALARRLARHSHTHVAMAPDGSLFVADSRLGAVWHVRRSAL